MSGRLQETSFSAIKERQQSEQRELAEFTDVDVTYIAVVSKPRGGIEDSVDEVWQELGMPEWALEKFLARRSGYRTNSAIDDPHNQAYTDMNLRGIYQSHLHSSSEAKRRLNEAVERLYAGENITLVCYEDDGESCHRHLLIDEIRKRVESRENCKFTLSA